MFCLIHNEEVSLSYGPKEVLYCLIMLLLCMLPMIVYYT